MTIITSKIRKTDGKLVRIHDDGHEEVLEIPPSRPMTEQEILEAALSDPDNQPLTKADLQRMKRTPRVKIIRIALMMTQEEFAVRFHIPVGTLRDWEQGRSEPDQATRAYLKIIAAQPELVEKTLAKTAA